METDTQKELEELRKKVEQLTEEKAKLLSFCESIVTRNQILSEHLDAYYEVRRRVDWLKELVARHRDMINNADLQDDAELLAVVEARLETGEVPLTPEFGSKEVAQLVGVSEARIIKLYKESTIYHSVGKYLNNLRMMRAMRLLHEHPEYKIDIIATEAGFNCVRTLVRQMQDAIGMSPAEFRLLVTDS